MRASASRRQAGGVRVASASLYTAPSIPLRHFTTQKQSKFLHFFLHFYYNNLFVIAIRKPRQPLCSSLALPHATRPLRAPLSHCPFLGSWDFVIYFTFGFFAAADTHAKHLLLTEDRSQSSHFVKRPYQTHVSQNRICVRRNYNSFDYLFYFWAKIIFLRSPWWTVANLNYRVHLVGGRYRYTAWVYTELHSAQRCILF